MDPKHLKALKRAISLSELNGLCLGEEKQLLGAMLLARSLGMIAGPRGSGKSLLAMLIAFAIAGEKELEPWGVGAGATVCYLDGEMRIRGFQQRLQQLAANVKGDEAQKSVGERITVISRDLAGDTIGALDTIEGQQVFDALIPRDAALIIVDNLSAFTTGGSEDIKSWQTIKNWLLKKRVEGTAVLLLHHTGKAGGQRGTSAHEDLLDYSISVTPTTPSDDGKTEFDVEHTKLRDHIPELRGKQHIKVWTEAGLMKFSSDPKEPVSSAVVQLVQENMDKYKTQVALAAALGLDKYKVHRIIKELRKAQANAADTDIAATKQEAV